MLKSRDVGIPSHFSAERVYLVYKMGFRQPADSRVAWHPCSRVRVPCHQQRRNTSTGANKGGLDPCMTRSYHYYVKILLHGVSIPRFQNGVHDGTSGSKLAGCAAGAIAAHTQRYSIAADE